MLAKLVIENLALIDYLDLDISPGFVVLSGETGAGKSLILGALSLILGDRASADLVRAGTDRAVVQAVFDGVDLPSEYASFIEDGQIIVSREVSASGRSSARINGRLVTASVLREIAAFLVDFHGQHEHQSLLRLDKQRQLLDQFGGEQVNALLADLSELASQYQKLGRQLQELCGDERERERTLDLLRFQREEIAAARLKAGEEEELLSERQLMGNYERLHGAVEKSYDLLYRGQQRNQSAIEQLGEVVNEISTAARFDAELTALAAALQDAMYQLEDAARTLRDYGEKLTFDPARLDSVEQRLDLLNKLKRKYGDSVEGIIAYGESVAADIERLLNSEELIAACEKQRQQIIRSYREKAVALSDLRLKAGDRLRQVMEQQCKELGLKDARFIVSVTHDPQREPHRNGTDEVEFLFSANLGEPPRPLSRVVSGGELSRLMLALKTSLASDERQCLVFDEVDAGLGGRVASAVGEKLLKLSRRQQVISITHLASIAALADQHLQVAKATEGEQTFSRVYCLQDEARIRELERLLGGEPSETAYQHARELLANGEQLKQAK